MAFEVINDPTMNRYELTVDGTQAGVADYVVRDGVITFVHTEIDPNFRGQGLGDELARGAFNLVRAESDARVVTLCPFMKKWIDEHPDYHDLRTR